MYRYIDSGVGREQLIGRVDLHHQRSTVWVPFPTSCTGVSYVPIYQQSRFGTWADLRDFPPKRYMHGYCAGAPGTGIMARRMMDAGRGGERARVLAERVRRSVDSLPLNSYDHLCCGNAAIAEYYLTVADYEAAGRVLGALLERRRREGEYRDAYSAASGQVSASLFNGICGIGYEMLRYARPHDVPSIL